MLKFRLRLTGISLPRLYRDNGRVLDSFSNKASPNVHFLFAMALQPGLVQGPVFEVSFVLLDTRYDG
jgi:hypothetical protein